MTLQWQVLSIKGIGLKLHALKQMTCRISEIALTAVRYAGQLSQAGECRMCFFRHPNLKDKSEGSVSSFQNK